ncbi:hypothetical protein A2U01_0015818, partial [Trifolium medium]|nr:hypothetical protein [Trifolium medium]
HDHTDTYLGLTLYDRSKYEGDIFLFQRPHMEDDEFLEGKSFVKDCWRIEEGGDNIESCRRRRGLESSKLCPYLFIYKL